MARKTKGESNSAATSHVNKADSSSGAITKPNQKRSRSENTEKPSDSRKMPKRAAACSDFTPKSLRLSRKSSPVATKRKAIVEDEMTAIDLTSGHDHPGHDHPVPNRRLTDFTFHDADGKPQPVEKLEADNVFISGLILPLEESSDKEKDKGVTCEGFGRIESWAISGYEEGSPVIWISTNIAHYECLKPANKYKKQYSLFFEKAHASVEVYKKLSRACGGNPDLTLDELLAAVVRSMNDSKNFAHGTSIKEFLISKGEFIYIQLIGLDDTSKENDQIFRDLPVLAALKDESRKHGSFVRPKGTSSGSVPNTSLKTGDRDPINQSSSSDSRKMPKRAAACSDFTPKSLRLSRKSSLVATKRKAIVEDEMKAIDLTSGHDHPVPNRRLTDFTFHDADGKPQPVEMLEVDNVFISGLILPLEESSDKEKNKGVICEGFGRIESWAISGYEEGSPVIWISTNIAHYECLKPANKYKKQYSLFFEKAHASVEVYKKLSRACGGNPDLTLDELLAAVVRSMNDSKNFAHGTSIKEFLISKGEFIYIQLIGLDDTSKENDQIFRDLPVLAALKDESRKHGSFVRPKGTSSGSVPNTSLKTGDRDPINQSSSSDSRKMPKRAAACSDFTPKSLRLSRKSSLVATKRKAIVEDETKAIDLTSGHDHPGHDHPVPNRRLTDFTFHDADGKPQPVEMLEVDNVFISGLILPLEESSDKEKNKGVTCEGFGRIESWAISGYEEGSPVIWISTNIAHYECLKPANKYKKQYSLFFEKAHASVEVYKKLSRACGGNPDLTLDELLAAVVRSMNDSKNFAHGTSIKEFLILKGEFIYIQLIGLDDTSKENDQIFRDLPVLAALKDESRKHGSFVHPKGTSSGSVPNTSLKTGDRDPINQSSSSDSRKMPKRAAACSDFTPKSLCLSRKSSLVATKRKAIVEDEMKAIDLTSGHDHPVPNRRLTDFTFHDADGKPQPVEMLEVDDVFISGLILPLEESSDKEKDKGVTCEGFGRIESWAISGYEEGTPVIWISTNIAHYECLKPANKYKKQFSLFFEKAHACVEVYKKLSRACGGNPDLTLDELLAAVVRSMNDSKNFPHGTSIKEFLISKGEFIYNQLIGLDDTSKENDKIFRDLPVLAALKDDSRKHGSFVHRKGTSSGSVPNTSLKIGDRDPINQSSSSAFGTEEDEDMKLARLLQEEENWRSMKHDKRQRQVALSSKFYVKINEDEIANDYPLPAYYKTTDQETDEYIIIFGNDSDISNPDGLPLRTLHNWSLYNSDSRLISLEILPMKPCADIDVTIYGSGNVTDENNRWISLDEDENQSSSSSATEQTDGIPIYLSAIKEWKIEYGISEVSILIRTDMARYRLGKPSKQYASWFGPVLKTARLAISIINLLKDQTRVSRLSFADVIKRVSEFDKNNRSYISSNPAVVERYVVVHGQIISQHFAEYPDGTIRKCAFVTGLCDKMEERHHTKWLVKKKVVLKKGGNLNPIAAMAPVVSKRKAMPATTTRLINRVWGEYYSNYLPEDSKEAESHEVKEDDEAEEEEAEDEDEDSEEVEEDKMQVDEKTEKSHSAVKLTKSPTSHKDIKWDGETTRKTCAGEALYKQAIVRGDLVAVGGCVLVETVDLDESPSIYFVEYMFENSDARKMIHGRVLIRAFETVLGNAANEREVFLTNDCLEFELGDVKETVVVEFRLLPWGYQHRKANAQKDMIDRERADEIKSKGLPMEYYCKSLYWPQQGAFFCLPTDTMGLGSGVCHSCNIKESQRVNETFKLDFPGSDFTLRGIEYHVNDFLYLAPHHFSADNRDHVTFKSGRNVGLKAYVVCQLLEIEVPKASKQACPESTKIKIRRFFRPEDISTEKAYCSDIREVYYSEQILMVPVMAIEGKCEVRKKHDLPSLDSPEIFEHIFFCEHLYDPDKGTIKQLPAHIKLGSSKEKVAEDAAYRKNKRKSKEGENNSADNDKQTDVVQKNLLATLDIFAGCGGLSEGLQQAGVSLTKWAIEYEKPAGEAFSLNHPEALMFVNNCNVILRAIMSACGDEDDCISTSEATELAKKLDEKEINNLPRPGQVEFINGGPPCQGFSGMNRFNQGSWSKVQCEMILAFLSFADYFRPRFFLLENVRNFVSFNKGQTFRLTLASLLEMGYQVRFGILDAGAYGVSQSRKRAFIWAASPKEILPEWPEPMHVFAGPQLKVTLSGNSKYAAVRSTANGAPFRSITVKDTIGDLPAVVNGASATIIEYKNEPVSWFQKKIRENMPVLTDHISKEMNELNRIRCQRIPKRPGADWRDLPEEKVSLSEGQVVDLIPWCLPNTAKRHNQWKGLFGRLDWDGNFPTSVTDPQPMGKVGMCFHPVQDRIITVRECARSQGFRDRYKFAGNIQHKHRQIGNAVPPPLAFALGRKLKEVI